VQILERVTNVLAVMVQDVASRRAIFESGAVSSCFTVAPKYGGKIRINALKIICTITADASMCQQVRMFPCSPDSMGAWHILLRLLILSSQVYFEFSPLDLPLCPHVCLAYTISMFQPTKTSHSEMKFWCTRGEIMCLLCVSCVSRVFHVSLVCFQHMCTCSMHAL
jgi:hypothetical protein